MPSHQHSQPSPQAPSVGLSQSSSTKRMSWRQRVDADRLERAEIEFLQVGRDRLQDHLDTGNSAGAGWGSRRSGRPSAAARAAHRRRSSGFGPERAQRRGRVKGAGADLHVVGLEDDAALVRPVGVQRQDQPLEGAARGACGRAAQRTRKASGGSDERRPVLVRRHQTVKLAAVQPGRASVRRLRQGQFLPGHQPARDRTELRIEIKDLDVAAAAAEFVGRDRPERLPRITL